MKRTKNDKIQMNFSTPYMERKTRVSQFYKNMEQLLDWRKIETLINRHYTKGYTLKGEKPYSGLVLFKILLVGVWNNMSDERTEDYVNESVSAMRFCGLDLEDPVPDHSTLSRFRSALTTSGAMDKLLRVVNKCLEKQSIILKTGVNVDASLTASPFSPKGKTTYEIAQDREEDEVSLEETKKQAVALKKLQGKGVDEQARWLKKGNDTVFGYKKHHAVDDNGMVLAVHTTTANEHDSKGLKPLVKKTPKKNTSRGLKADKGYKVPANDEFLKQEGIKNRIQHKAYRNRPLSSWQKVFNKLVSKTRYVVERTFGGMQRWFGSGRTRYKGLAKTHTLHILEAICYNLKRAPGLLCQVAK